MADYFNTMACRLMKPTVCVCPPAWGFRLPAATDRDRIFP